MVVCICMYVCIYRYVCIYIFSCIVEPEMCHIRISQNLMQM